MLSVGRGCVVDRRVNIPSYYLSSSRSFQRAMCSAQNKVTKKEPKPKLSVMQRWHTYGEITDKPLENRETHNATCLEGSKTKCLRIQHIK